MPSIKSLWPCCCLKAFKLTYVHFLSCLFSRPFPFIAPSFLPPLPHTHRHTHTPVFWFEAPFCSSQRPPFCSCFSLHARPVALPAPTFPRAALFCGSLLISLQFSFVGLFFSISDLPSSFAWPLVFSSVNVWITELFLEKKKNKREKKKTALYFVLPRCHGLDLGPEASPQPSCSHTVLSEAEALRHWVTSCFYLQIHCMTQAA